MTAAAQPAGPRAFISPVARPVPLRQSVYEALVELVVSGRLGPGEHLVETELARQLGVSRQPVREALHRLEAEGWVDLRPNQGAFVHVPTDHEVDELLDVPGAARGADGPAGRARGISRRDSPAAGDLGRGAGAVASGETERIVAANNEFHAELARVAGNAVLADLARIVSRRVRWYYRQVAPLRGQQSWAEHRQLIDAVEAKDQERAAEIARKHTEGTRSAYHQQPHAEHLRAGGPR